MSLYHNKRALPIISEFSDESPITEVRVRHFEETALGQAVLLPLKQEDFSVFDHMRIMHDRIPHQGNRKIPVSMR